ncbi:hypothetical protein P0L94_12690 [Microbacter sp. GSS18]|nr:hypothetical protein P0L94_12690 [Microbacter sp. GSS18]
MTATAITWLAHSVDAEQLARARAFVESIGLDVISDTGDVIMAQTARGDIVEYCGPDAEVPPHLFAGQSQVAGFLVEDLDAAVARLAEQGFATVGDAGEGGGVRFQHVIGPAGDVVGLVARQPE